MFLSKNLLLAWGGLLSVFCWMVLMGCQPSQTVSNSTGHAQHDHDHDHDHDHNVPTSLSEAIQAIESHSSAIKKAFTTGEPHDAHDALHEIGHAIEAFRGLAAKEITDTALSGSVREATEKLLDAYGTLDEGMHGGKETKYETLEQSIEESLQVLRKAVSAR